MALRSEKTGLCIIVLALAAAPAGAIDFPARHNHWRGGCAGILTLDSGGVAFRQIGAKKKPHAWAWPWQDIQGLDIGDDRSVLVRTYRDSRLRLGRDVSYEFRLDGSPDLRTAWELLRTVAGARFTARFALPGETLDWELPAKRLRRTGGVEGVLRVYPDRVVFASSRPGESRTWRDSDIALLSSAGQFHLSLAAESGGGTYEFQLRQSLSPERYEKLWLRLEARRGLNLLSETSGK
jgi:hypothetical protein